jgi:5-methylcytosine-specific restriction endonuclease McrA
LDYRCQICGLKKKPSELAMDHIIPRAKGGNGGWENLQPLCKSCNSSKHISILEPSKELIWAQTEAQVLGLVK